MPKKSIIPILLIVIISGCIGAGIKQGKPPVSEKETAVSDESLEKAWEKADRCTKCHMAWSWEYGYYRGWDRHGFISDYSKHSPFGYKDPYGPGIPINTFHEYYYTDWWKGPWLDEHRSVVPEMHFDGYGPINDGVSKPEDFTGKVIIVDQSGSGNTATIQDAVNRADKGTTIFVRPGVYKESIRLKPGIRLWGAKVKTTIIDSGTKSSGIIAANGCDISGFTITGTGMDYDKLIFTAGVHAVDCDSTLVIRGNIFYSNAVFGILTESSRTGGTPKNPAARYIKPENSMKLLSFKGYSNPRIIGNTFYMIGERAIYCIHSSPEIANNIFMGNVKTVGMTQLSKPFIHHNVFYRNNVSLNINRSMPIVSNNIMLKNYWGQRVIEGSYPFIHDNITWESPWYKEFAEDGRPVPYKPFPGHGELEKNPVLAKPDAGNFRISQSSPFKHKANSRTGYGLLKGYGIQLPPSLPCEKSWAEEFLHRNDTTEKIISEIERQNGLIKILDLSYLIEYRSFMNVKYDSSGNQISVKIDPEPVSGTTCQARMVMSRGMRYKKYASELFNDGKTAPDSGVVVFDGERVRVSGGRFKTDSRDIGDIHQVGERPTRENIGGLYMDYDQYLNGAIGPGGTFYFGYLRILGGEVLPKKEMVDGHECIVIQYPHLGTDQIYKFYLDPSIGYRPRKLEHYFERC
ncbi:MAG: right-handed parallel beta-helix repeat-containing protein, partial [Candidatus Latescibacterota bacterium]